ncbi:hydantoinase/oxoprolinase family protein [Epidermidibacterium keratini]|uniref:Hydantoinase/oxoprolinase family protein n=1 Tax=Epidermidibacterium keratini TaxID=1891644 RepID=A0A7L4YHE8_9ACTN|nr:hydantoinase/oxoprolinase family protein [Epidermidibacterium keratini]QHB99000.1 hydantoinase/oxoprolinase family protein [Epidermidibacterium keratini]
MTSSEAPAGRAGHIRIGVDTGGTFTDIVAVDASTGAIATTKTPSTPSNPADGFLNGIEKILEQIGAQPTVLESISHGTTVATNQLLEGKVGELGFITTEGYEFVLEIARQSVPDGYGNSYFWVKPDRIVPADKVKTVGGRLNFQGEEVRPFDREQAVKAVRWFKDRGISTIGVCLLHAYANDSHEQAMLEVIREEYPEAVVSLSSQVLREYREYERTMTTLVDAAVKPKVAAYVAGIAERLAELDTDRTIPFSIMRSNGGVLSADEVVHQPITTVLSGPAAGALGAAVIAQNAGFSSIVTCDGGGTSTDVTVIQNGQPTLTTEGTVGAYPSKIPMIDVVTVGAGGGSIAWIGPEGTLKVGPKSAGADPGPLCYAKGGTEPTITDAHLVLGRIPPHLLGGEIPLDVEAARTGIEELAGKLGLSFEECATGILEISAWNQANALRQVTVKRGLDVRDFPMVTFGGSGSLLACRLMDILGLPAVLVPPNPGNVSAYGLLTVDVRNDYVQTQVSKHESLDLGKLGALFEELTGKAKAALEREGFPAEAQRFERSADLRYFGQAFEVRVDAPDGEITQEWADEVADRFHAAHHALYNYDFKGNPEQLVEWVNVRVTGIGPIARPEITDISAGSGAESAVIETREVYYDDWSKAKIYDRAKLGAGDEIEGPAVIQEFGSTVPIHPGFSATIDKAANIIIKRKDA